MTDKKIILLIGKTGNGKSTLANVISGKNELREGEFGVSETKDIQPVDFEVYGDKYRLIDTIGIGDTELSLREVLYKLAKMSNLVKNGLNQVLFVTSGRFTEEERSTYNLLRKFIFDEGIVKYTTIVRTNFPNFNNGGKCQEDIQKMIANGGELAEVIHSCQERIIHVNNPPLNLEDEDEVAFNQKKRERSRTVLLAHLVKCEDIYKPENLDTLNERIDNYMTENEKLEREIEETRKNMLEQEKKTQREINEVRKRGDKQVQQLHSDKERQINEIRQNNERQMRTLQEQNRQIEEQMRQLRLGIGIRDDVSSALNSFYNMSEVEKTDR